MFKKNFYRVLNLNKCPVTNNGRSNWIIASLKYTLNKIQAQKADLEQTLKSIPTINSPPPLPS